MRLAGVAWAGAGDDRSAARTPTPTAAPPARKLRRSTPSSAEKRGVAQQAHLANWRGLVVVLMVSLRASRRLRLRPFAIEVKRRSRCARWRGGHFLDHAGGATALRSGPKGKPLLAAGR